MNVSFYHGVRGLWHGFLFPTLLKRTEFVLARKQSLCLQPSKYFPGIA
jgi:hypothetical protein